MNANVPEAVKRGAARADELAAAFAAQHNGVPEGTAAAEEAAAAVVAGTAPAETPLAETPPAETPPAETPPAEPAAQAAKPREDWKQKYSILQGKYDAEVPRLHRNVEELTTQLAGLRNVLASMQAAPEVQPTPAAEATFDLTKIVSPAEVEEYGQDLLDLVSRVANGATAPLQNQIHVLENENARLNQNLTGVSSRVAQNSQQDVYTKLDAAVEDWRDLNVDAGFHAWLNETDPLFGATRAKALRAAFDAEDAVRVIRFFNLYKEEHATPPTSASTPAPAQPGGKIELETLAAPGHGRPGAGGGAPTEEGRIIPRKEITQFYADVQKGVYAGRDADKAKMEREIFAAAAQGRVQ